MTDSDTFSDPLYVLLGSLVTAVVAGIGWLCKNKCRDQSCDCDSGCCRFHSSSRIRETIRQEIQAEMQRSQSDKSDKSDSPPLHANHDIESKGQEPVLSTDWKNHLHVMNEIWTSYEQVIYILTELENSNKKETFDMVFFVWKNTLFLMNEIWTRYEHVMNTLWTRYERDMNEIRTS